MQRKLTYLQKNRKTATNTTDYWLMDAHNVYDYNIVLTNGHIDVSHICQLVRNAHLVRN